MPIRKKWTKLTPSNLNKVPHDSGAYELASRNKKIIDIGKGEDLHRRLKQKRKIRKTASHFRFSFAGLFGNASELEGEHSRKYQKKHGRKPKYTKRSPRSIFNLFGF